MSTIDHGHHAATGRAVPVDRRDEPLSRDDEHLVWADRTRVVLSPIAAPSILGLFGFSAATLMVGANLAGWVGGPTSGVIFAPFALVFGGIAQFLAGMWSYKARDGLATAMHGMWGSFWIGYGILFLLMGTGALPMATGDYQPAFGMWFVMLGLLTGIGAIAALGRNLGMFSVLILLSAGSCLAAAAYLSGSHTTLNAAGWVFVASVGAAVYTATSLLFAESFGRTILPTGAYRKNANVPGRMATYPLEYPSGMPGVKAGQ